MKSISRRTAIAGGVATVAVVTSGVGEAAVGATRPVRLRRHDFEAAVGKVFRAQHGTTTTRMRLVRIDDVGMAAAARDLSFVLVFEPLGATAADAIYTLTRRGLPTHALLLSSLGTDGRLQAVVNGAR